ncbi:DUF58 domain-containing protein [Candidatus Laterigemmans baculatus]|nr:DUF58 domain-containing protein [Candidatus Laterigemmans baculatus]
MDEVWKKYFEPRTLERLRGLRLAARRAAEGAWSGAHRNPRSGRAIEFSEYRPYTTGDDLRQVDWKVYARTNKFYLRRREDETTLDCHFLVDASGSMGFASEAAASNKLVCALRIAASLAFVAAENHDRASLTSVGAAVTPRLPAGSGPGHLLAMATAMDAIELEPNVRIASQLAAAAQSLPSRGLVVILSDLFDDAESLLKTIRGIRQLAAEVLAIQVTDPAEAEFPFSETTEFVGLEDQLALTADSRGIAAAYREEFARHRGELAAGCHAAEVTFWSLSTSDPLHVRLPQLLQSAAAR